MKYGIDFENQSPFRIKTPKSIIILNELSHTNKATTLWSGIHDCLFQLLGNTSAPYKSTCYSSENERRCLKGGGSVRPRVMPDGLGWVLSRKEDMSNRISFEFYPASSE